MQIFVSNKGYVCVSAMKSVSEFPKYLNMFGKEFGVSDAIKTTIYSILRIIADSNKCQKSKEVRQCCHKIGTTPRILERSTQWTNRAEIYIGLLK